MLRNRRCLMVSLLLLALAGTAMAATIPTPTGLTINYVSGRQVRLRWYRVSVSGSVVNYDVYRDNVKLQTVVDGQNDPETDGQIWYSSGSYRYFNDMAAWPGHTHNYMVVARVGTDESTGVSKEISIPVPVFPTLTATYKSGRTAYLRWDHVGGGFNNLRYDIFRDDVKIAEFGPKSQGTAENGDSWEFSITDQFFYDNNVFPGQNHHYKVVATLFPGSDASISKEVRVNIPLPSFPEPSISYQGGRTVQFYWSHAGPGFSDVRYQVYRDGVKRAEFAAKTSGAGDNGDSWDFNSVRQYYSDSGAFPGQTHTYHFVATLFPGCDISREVVYTVPSSAFKSVSISYSGVRTVELLWSRITSADFDVVYTVYRDGEALASFNADATGSAENGDSWKIKSSYQYFYDANAWPGKVHQYKVVAHLFPGCELSVEKDFQVPHSILSAPRLEYQSGRNVQLNWRKIVSHPTFDVIQYTIFRDGVELASFTADTEGTGANNDSWRSDRLYQYYVDGTAVPWQTHQYRIEARLFEGCQVARESDYTVPGPKVSKFSSTVMSVDSVNLNLGSISAKSFADATLEIYRDGRQIGVLTPTNNAFPATYLDTGINVPEGPHYYQFLFRLYPGCDSGMSAQFPLTIPTPQAPNLVLVKNELGAVTLRVTGANIETPQKYEIYKDGFLLATTETGVTVDYVDTSYGPGRLVEYKAQTRFDKFPSSYVSGESTPLHVVKLLAPDQLMSVVTPYKSDVSPAWVDGDSNAAYIPIELSVDNVQKGNVRYYSEKSWYADAMGDPGKPSGIPLNPDAPTSLKLTARPDATISLGCEITWTPTDLSRRSSSEPALHIRKGDSLLLTASGQGALLEIDADGDGVYELSGVPGQKFPVAFNVSGIVAVGARIDGVAVGSMNVAVAAVSQAPEICYLRTLSASDNNIVMVDFEKPLSLFPDIGGYVPESSKLDLSSKLLSSTRMRFTLPTTRDSYVESSLMTRLRHYRGPALSHTVLRVIMVSIDGRSYSPVLERYADGTCLYGNSISMVEKFPALSMIVTLTNAGAIFADTGTTVKIVRADEFDQNGQANLYILSKPTGASAGYGIAAEMLVDDN